ncbi:pentapeptide repeat-containing protein [Paractinoplanes deccanensis]|uniref:pentapeptide repeat-containing protein n=1 Tax=Paractinoplanes deccanensis TaxID=113561 RepID=UPI001944506B|nr:pentapeptide repeat-containing protein [Actinoplanes deccanensis]
MTTLTAMFALLISGLSLRVTEEGQLTNRFSTAIEQLGSEKPDTRVGAIYALGELALDSDEDRPVITDLLIDFVRAKTQMDGAQADPAKICREGDATPRDVVAALRLLLFDLTDAQRVHRADLRQACLKEVDLPGADLTCVDMDGAVVYASIFVGASFARASLPDAQLEGSEFNEADFTGALVNDAYLGTAENTDVATADLRGANLRDADFSRASFAGVDLSGADLTRTVLTGADMRDVVIGGGSLPTYVDDARNLPQGVEGTLSRAPVPPHRGCPGRSASPPGCPKTETPVLGWLDCWLEKWS